MYTNSLLSSQLITQFTQLSNHINCRSHMFFKGVTLVFASKDNGTVQMDMYVGPIKRILGAKNRGPNGIEHTKRHSILLTRFDILCL